MSYNYDPGSGDRNWFERLREKFDENRSVFIAGSVTLGLFLWVITGIIFDTSETSTPPTLAAQVQNTDIFTVQTRSIPLSQHARQLTLQGRTEADRHVKLSAETPGTIAKLNVEKGTRVKTGDVICTLDMGARRAQLDEAMALQASRQIEYEAAETLVDKGHVSKSQLAAAKASYDAAVALAKMRRVELQRTQIRAPFDGIIDRMPFEVGDFLPIGGLCATLIDKDPLVVVTYVSEQQVNFVEPGARVNIALATGDTVDGVVRYVAESPDSGTRAFEVEIEIANPDGRLHDGVSAQARITTGEISASLIPQSTFTLNDDGIIGVRVVRDAVVHFIPIEILTDSSAGAWVTGLNDGDDLIVVGQDFVRSGEKVNAIPEPDDETKKLLKFSSDADQQ